VKETSSLWTRSTAIESAWAETSYAHPKMDREIHAIPRDFGRCDLVNPNRRRRVWGSMSAAARVYLRWQLGRFGLRRIGRSGAAISGASTGSVGAGDSVGDGAIGARIAGPPARAWRVLQSLSPLCAKTQPTVYAALRW
jgi:hypothetical protein